MSGDHKPQVGPVMMFTPKKADVARFYTDVVGLVGERVDDAVWLDTDNAKVVVRDPDDRQTPPEITHQAGFVVWIGVSDVRAAFDRAQVASATASAFFGDYFFARDPDGRYVGIYALEDAHGHGHEH